MDLVCPKRWCFLSVELQVLQVWAAAALELEQATFIKLLLKSHLVSHQMNWVTLQLFQFSKFIFIFSLTPFTSLTPTNQLTLS